MHNERMRLAVLLVLICRALSAQSFDVASIKPAAPPSARGGRSMAFSQATQDPGRLTLNNQSLTSLIMRAYRLPRYQVTAPDWMDTVRFDIAAKIPPGSTKEQIDIMLQKLLAERFHLIVHPETKEIASYDLVIGKKGPRLKETDYKEDPSRPEPPPGPIKKDANGFPVLNSPNVVVSMRMVGSHGASAHMAAKAQPLSVLTNMLSRQLRAPVVDKTGLTAKYDFTLEYAPQGPGIAPAPSASGEASLPDESGAPIQTAIQEQLGLRLEAKKEPVAMLIVDKADKLPTEN